MRFHCLDRSARRQGQLPAVQTPPEDLPVRSGVEFQSLLLLGNRQRQILRPRHFARPTGQRGRRQPNDRRQESRNVPCGPASIAAKRKGCDGRPLKRSIQRATQILLQMCSRDHCRRQRPRLRAGSRFHAETTGRLPRGAQFPSRGGETLVSTASPRSPERSGPAIL